MGTDLPWVSFKTLLCIELEAPISRRSDLHLSTNYHDLAYPAQPCGEADSHKNHEFCGNVQCKRQEVDRRTGTRLVSVGVWWDSKCFHTAFWKAASYCLCSSWYFCNFAQASCASESSLIILVHQPHIFIRKRCSYCSCCTVSLSPPNYTTKLSLHTFMVASSRPLPRSQSLF